MSKTEVLRYDMISLHPDRINIVHMVESKGSSKHSVDNTDNEDSLSYNNEPRTVKFNVEDKLSEQTQRKLKRAIKYINYVTKKHTIQRFETSKPITYKLTFVTLTLSSPQVHSDQLIKNLLINQFIVEAKKHWKVEYFIWRLEKQSNGNAHFHFIMDKFIPHDQLRECWNRIQNKLGYVDRYTARMQLLDFKSYCNLFKNNVKYDKAKVLAAWKKGKATGWKYPNSTDVHALFFINSLDAYLIKYLSKDEQNKGIAGRMWGCSHNLSNLTGAREIVDSSLLAELERISLTHNYKTIADRYYTIIYISITDLQLLKCTTMLTMLKDYFLTNFSIDISSS